MRNCPECHSSDLIYDSDQGEVVCRNCGFVVADKVQDLGPEWRVFEGEERERRIRTGAPVTYAIHDKGLVTIIGWKLRDACGKELGPSERAELSRLRKLQRRIRIFSSLERNLASALSHMMKLASVLSLPESVLEEAALIYRKTMRKRLTRGRSIKGTSAASIYLACRKLGITRTLHEIAKAAGIARKDLARFYRLLIDELGGVVGPPSPASYATKFVNELNLTGRAEVVAREVLSTAQSMLLTSGRGPMGIAAAATYMASVLVNDKRTQRDISDVAGVTEVTIRNRYRELLRKLEVEVRL